MFNCADNWVAAESKLLGSLDTVIQSRSKKQNLISRNQRFRKKKQVCSKLTRDPAHTKNTKCSRREITSCRGEPRRRSDEWAELGFEEGVLHFKGKLGWWWGCRRTLGCQSGALNREHGQARDAGWPHGHVTRQLEGSGSFHPHPISSPPRMLSGPGYGAGCTLPPPVPLGSCGKRTLRLHPAGLKDAPWRRAGSNKPGRWGLLSFANHCHQLQGESFLSHRWPEIWLTHSINNLLWQKRKGRGKAEYILFTEFTYSPRI